MGTNYSSISYGNFNGIVGNITKIYYRAITDTEAMVEYNGMCSD
jgi:hypothetical protein